MKLIYRLFILFCMAATQSTQGQTHRIPTYEEYIKAGVASEKEIQVFLHEMSWAKFDPITGYHLGNYIPHDGLNGSSTLSTVQANGARTAFVYAFKPGRINAYGDSFTQCHQVSDGETWEEYLAAAIAEPVRNFGMGGFGLYQSYRRMLETESGPNAAPYVMLYIWGDDHIRSLFRCRYMNIKSWMRDQQTREGEGRMFHGNFWANVEMDLHSGQLVERPNLISKPEDLVNMTRPDWMYRNLKDDLALQMALFKRGETSDIDRHAIGKLAQILHFKIDLSNQEVSREQISGLLDQYAFAASRCILEKAGTFAARQHKKLMIIIFDPYQVTKPMLKGVPRYDQEVVNYLQKNKFNYFDMNLIHAADFKNFNLSVDDYFKRYFIGHYNPSGNHFFAYSILPRVVDWLDPKPVPYQNSKTQLTTFKGYLEGF